MKTRAELILSVSIAAAVSLAGCHVSGPHAETGTLATDYGRPHMRWFRAARFGMFVHYNVFSQWGRPDSPHVTANERGRWQADLSGLAIARLRMLGVNAVYGGGLCTYADEVRFYSYRRDGSTGRMLSFVHRLS